jgi:prevent-host-death family protein
MKRLHLDKDILPLSEFRANAASLIEKVKTGHRPLVITQHGKSSAVLLDVSDYEKMVETIETLQEVSQARQELVEGKGVPHDEGLSSLKKRLKQLK